MYAEGADYVLMPRLIAAQHLLEMTERLLRGETDGDRAAEAGAHRALTGARRDRQLKATVGRSSYANSVAGAKARRCP